MPRKACIFILFSVMCAVTPAAARPPRYLVWLEEPPLAEAIPDRKAWRSAEAAQRRAALERGRQALAGELGRRGLRVIAAEATLVNVIVAEGDPGKNDPGEIPGVRAVFRLAPLKRHLNRALDLTNASAAWSTLGGQQNAGAGTRIAILDTGVDHNHPMMRDPSLTVPAGFPRGDAAFTNSKVIVARSYVDIVARFDGQLESTRPDDLSPRDRVGKGTALASIAAGAPADSPLGRISGIAPKAWVGNYKIFGSPGVNDATYIDAVLRALSDAAADGMDVALLSFGTNPAEWTLTDRRQPDCPSFATDFCDPFAVAVENAARAGLAVVTSAGNDGDLGLRFPALNSINSPGSAPSAITVGATTNAHALFQTVTVRGAGNPPEALGPAYALFSDGPLPSGPLTAGIRLAPGNARACSPLPAGSMEGVFALVEGGDCLTITKVTNVANAGAVGMILYRQNSEFLFRMQGVATSGIPSVQIRTSAGQGLRTLLQGNAGTQVTIDPAYVELRDVESNTVAAFSSRGPNINALEIKPELVAPGTDLFFATQTYDPNGDLWSPTGWSAGNGASFSAALVAGAVALVKQRYPSLTAAQLKSAVVNTANAAVDDFDAQGVRGRARVTAVGAGRLDAGGAVQTNVTVEPAAISFGRVQQVNQNRTLRLTNIGMQNLNLTLAVERRDPDSRANLTLSSSTAALNAGQSTEIQVRLQGNVPNAGQYEGAILVSGGATPLRIPFWYAVSDNRAANIFSTRAMPFLGDAGRRTVLSFKLVDQFGLPIPNANVQFTPRDAIESATPATDALGIGAATILNLNTPGEDEIVVQAGGLQFFFDGRSRPVAAINNNGIVNAASFELGPGLAPGSYMTIFGAGLSEASRTFSTPYLPLSLSGVSVSFDDTSRGISVPGRLHFVRDNQVNVQIPWELAGSTSVQVKVSLGDSQTALVRVPLQRVSPGFFEYQDGSNRVAAARDEANAIVGSGNPVQRGRVVQFFVNGLGGVTEPQASGEAAPTDRLVRTTSTPTVTIGGQNAPVQFSGLAPGNAGLYQVNVVVPQNIGTGLQPVTLSIEGVDAKATQIAVR
jgi:minor extracellular serine protease Vpr